MTIESLGAAGDGLGSVNGRRLVVPGALPGERVRVRVEASLGEGRWRVALVGIDSASEDRVVAPCPHFGQCGGCSLQHLRPDALARWKRSLVVVALGRRGLGTVTVAQTRTTAPGGRRRCTLAWRRDGSACRLGFHAPGSHRLEPLNGCAALTPALSALLEPLRDLVRDLAPSGTRGQAILTDTETGVDLALTLPAAPGLAGRERLAAAADLLDLARLGIVLDGDGQPQWEPVAERRAPLVRFAAIPVTPPPGAFLQPSGAGERAITAAVLDRLAEGRGPVLDLFAGLGTLSLPMVARGRDVHAVDGDAAALAALAATGSPHGRLTTARHDLAREPLRGRALAGFEAAVFDPPRAGAKAQAESLADAGPPLVVAVSCHPATFARDARILVDGGYRLETVSPIDQFPWTAHVELVAAFRRPGPV